MTIATTMAQTNLLNVDRAQNEAMRVMLGDHKVHARPPTNANQTERGAGQSISQCRRKSPQPTPPSRERHKGMQTGTGQVLDGSSRGLNTASMPADRAQVNQGVGKVPKPKSVQDVST